MNTHTKPNITNTLGRLFATAGGAGYSPIAPGTCGTLVAVPLVYFCRTLPTLGYLLITLVITLLGIVAADIADKHWGTHDSGRIVIDEVAGYFVTMAFVDKGSWPLLWIGFVVFRFFDIVKPPPVRYVDQTLKGGKGVVLDDVAAGIYGLLVMLVIVYVLMPLL